MSGFLSWWKNYNTRAFCWMCACGYCGYMCVCAAVLRQDSWREYREKYSGDFLYLFGKSFFGFNPFAQHPAPLLLRRQRLGGGVPLGRARRGPSGPPSPRRLPLKLSSRTDCFGFGSFWPSFFFQADLNSDYFPLQRYCVVASDFCQQGLTLSCLQGIELVLCIRGQEGGQVSPPPGGPNHPPFRPSKPKKLSGGLCQRRWKTFWCMGGRFFQTACKTRFLPLFSVPPNFSGVSC